MAELSDVGRKAEAHLGHSATLDKKIALPIGHIEVWRSERRRPSKIAPFYVNPSGESFRTNASWNSFERMLRASRPPLSDTDLLVRLVAMGPGRRVVVTKEFEVPQQYRATQWAPLQTADGKWTAYDIETISGRWERLTIGSDYSMALDDLGPAPKTSIR